MLRFSQALCSDSRTDCMLRRGIERMIRLYLLRMYAATVLLQDGKMPEGSPLDPDMMSPGEKAFTVSFEEMYPSWYPKPCMLPAAMSLYAKLSDKKEEHILSLEEEYLMASVIQAMIDEYPAWRLVIADQDMHILKMDAVALALENGEMITEEEAGEAARSYTMPSEEWFDCCFFDSDYALLDTIDSSTLQDPQLSAVLGLADIQPDYGFSSRWWKEHKEKIEFFR